MQNLRKNLIISLIIVSLSFILFHDRKEYLSEDNILGVYINNELSDNYPSKDSAMFQKAVCDDSSTKVTWDNDNWGLLISNLNKKVKCNLYFYSGETVFDFDYTGTEQTFVAPVSGTYKLETWGAQGEDWSGVAGWEDETVRKEISGGVGGYANGYIEIDKGKKMFINVGKKGENYNPTGLNGSGPSGGGASYVSLINGNLKNKENDMDKIIIVSGGGGGSEWGNGQGGSGGGYIGSNGVRGTNINATGGTQTQGGKSAGIKSDSGTTNIYDGSFGQGGYSVGGDGGGQGGNGFYGGGASDFAYGGGGGSGYIGNPLLKDKVMYCYNCEESNEESTKTISTTCSEEHPTSNCAKKGNGYARITLVSIDE